MTLTVGQAQPSGLDALLGGLTSGAARGLQQSLEQFHEKKLKTQQGSAIANALGKPELGDIFAQLGPDFSKLLIEQYGAENLAENLSAIQGLDKPERAAAAPTPIPSSIEEIQEGEEIEPRGPEDKIDIPETITPPTEEEKFREIYDKTPAKQKPQVLKAYNEQKKIQEQKRTTGLKDTAKLRQEYASSFKAASKSIESKERLLKLIEKGDLTSPLVAGIAKFLPPGFRESLLSNDALQYEAGLFDEFGVLKGMFPGQIRTAEIKLLEPKLASLYKNDEAKKQIINAGIEAAKIDIIKGKKAAEVERERPHLSLLEFNEEVDKRSAPEIAQLGKDILGKLNAIADKYTIGNTAVPSGKVKMITPDGKLGFVDADEVERLEKLNYSRV